MIVLEDWGEEGGSWWVAKKPASNTYGESLRNYRVVPRALWKAYQTTEALLELLADQMANSPELPGYVAYREERDREHEAREKVQQKIAEEAARDRKVQEEIRRAGALAPLLKDCPTDEPVRIAALEPNHIKDGMFVYVVKTGDFDVEIATPVKLDRNQIAERAAAHVELVKQSR